MKALVAAAKKSDGDFRHVVQRARDDREQAAQHTALVEQLTGAGVRVIERPDYGDKTIRRVSALVGADDKRLTDAEHTTCPGHAVYIERTWQGVEAVAVCTDWRAHGHRDPSGASSRPAGPMDEKAKAERRAVIVNNREWKSAETVRREWLTGLLARKTPPKGAAIYVATELGHGPRPLSDAMAKANSLAATLLGADDRHSRQSVAALAAQASDQRAQVIALGVVLGAIEAATGVHSWRNPGEATQRYFAFLATCGYVLSDVEKLAAGTAKPRRGKRTDNPAHPDTSEATDQAAA